MCRFLANKLFFKVGAGRGFAIGLFVCMIVFLGFFFGHGFRIALLVNKCSAHECACGLNGLKPGVLCAPSACVGGKVLNSAYFMNITMQDCCTWS